MLRTRLLYSFVSVFQWQVLNRSWTSSIAFWIGKSCVIVDVGKFFFSFSCQRCHTFDARVSLVKKLNLFLPSTSDFMDIASSNRFPWTLAVDCCFSLHKPTEKEHLKNKWSYNSGSWWQRTRILSIDRLNLLLDSGPGDHHVISCFYVYLFIEHSLLILLRYVSVPFHLLWNEKGWPWLS